MTELLHILVVEDSRDDVELLKLALQRSGYAPIIRQVESAGEMADALGEHSWDAILSDYSLPNFSGPEALQLLQERGLDLPFIIVSGAVGESTAVAAMKAGAHDYVMKNNLTRLAPVLQREIAEAKVRRARRKAEQLLRTSQQKYESLLNSVDGIVWEAEARSLRVTFISKKANEILGYPTGNWLSKSSLWAQTIHPQDRPWVMRVYQNAELDQDSYQMEYRRLRADGATVWVRDLVSIVNEDGNAPMLRGIMVDVTEHHHAEEERERLLELAERRAHELAAIEEMNSAVRVAVTRTETLSAILNVLWELMPFESIGFSSYDVNNKTSTLEQTRSKDSASNIRAYAANAGLVQQIVHTPEPYRVTTKPASGQVESLAGIPLYAQETPLGILWGYRSAPTGNNDQPWPSTLSFSPSEIRILRSIAEIAGNAIFRSTLYEQTQLQAQQLQQIMDTAPQGLILLDDAHNVVLANPAAAEALTWLVGEYQSKPLTQIGDLSLADILSPSTKELSAHEFVIEEPEQRIFELSGHPVSSGDAYQGSVLVLRDVTERRQAQKVMEQQNRLAAVGQLAAGIAHDFNNTLSVITLHAQILQRSDRLNSTDIQRLQTIKSQIDHATNLVRQILDFSKRSVMQRTPVNLVSALQQFIDMLEHTLSSNVYLEFHHNEEAIFVEADATHLQQALVNLIVNARDAMPQGGIITITLSTQEQLPDQVVQAIDAQHREWVCISVSDTGTGIEPQVLSQLFQPFFTTKPPGQGTGLGLAQVYGIVEQHGGHVHVETEPGQGSCFSLYLPLIGKPLPDSQ